jgi:acyl carrier protein
MSNESDPRSRGSASSPLTPTESIVAKIWAEFLPAQDFGPDDDFIRLGGDSLLAKSVMVRICRQFGTNLPVSVLFRARTIRKLSDYVETAKNTSPRICMPPPAN